MVFHVPGGHTKSVHLGIFAHKSLYFLGFLRKSTTSISSCFSSSAQATSLKRILFFDESNSLALDLLKVIALFAIPHILQSMKNATTQNKIIVSIVGIISDQNFAELLSLTSIIVSISGFFNPKSFIESLLGRMIISLLVFIIQFTVSVSLHFSSTEFQVPLYVAKALFSSIKTLSYFPSLKFFSNLFNPIVSSV